MSANNQTLVKEYKGKWYVFTNVMAESWTDPNGKEPNILFVQEARASFPDEGAALIAAHALDADEWTEYGVHKNLAKDGARVTIKESKPRNLETSKSTASDVQVDGGKDDDNT